MSTKDHYVAQTYLKQFSNDENKLIPYHKGSPYLTEGKPTVPKAVCYTQDGDFNKYFKNPQEIKDFLVPIENKWSDIIQRVGRNKFESDDKYQICLYLAFLTSCTPTSVRLTTSYLEFVSPEDTSKVASSIYKCIKTDLRPVISEKIFENELTIKVDPDFSKALNANAIEDIANRLYCSEWHILFNETKFPFLTSDNPYCLYEVPDSEVVAVYAPLSPRIAILSVPDSTKLHLPSLTVNKWPNSSDVYGKPKASIVKQLNTLLVKSAEKTVLSSSSENWICELTNKYSNWHVGFRIIKSLDNFGIRAEEKAK